MIKEKKMNILEKYIRRGRRTASRIWGDTAVVLLLPWNKANFDNNFCELTPTATYIWKLLEKKPKVKEIIDLFAKKKRIDRKIATKEVVRFIKKLAAKKMIDILDNPNKD